MKMTNVTETIWNYFLVLEKDIEATTRFVEPYNQDDVYSIEFYKILVLGATECESAFKALCHSICGEDKGKISEYKMIILEKYPGIVNAEVMIPRAHRTIRPFENWENTKLDWWDTYCETKHNHAAGFSSANYLMAVRALGALYILTFYLSKERKEDFLQMQSVYFKSEYTPSILATEGGASLP